MFDTHTTSSISLYIHSTLCHFKRNIGWVKQTRYAGGNYEKTQSVSVLKALQHSFGADHEATFAECEILVWCISSVASSVLSVKGKKRRWRLSREIKNEISVSSRGHHHIRNTFTQNIRKTMVIVVVNIVYSYLPYGNSYLDILLRYSGACRSISQTRKTLDLS